MLATNTKLPVASLAWVQDLIQANIDSRDGLKEAIANLPPGASALAMLLSRVAEERADQATELQELVIANDELPQHSGSLTATAFRMWMDLRTALVGGEQALLEEAERSEDYIQQRYERALAELRGCPCTEVLRRHYDAIKDCHTAIRAFRDAVAAR